MTFYVPGLDLKKLTDDDLYERHSDLTRRLVVASRLGKGEVIQQIQNMLSSLELEKKERIYNDRIGTNMKNSSSVVIETDPDLSNQQTMKDAKENEAKKPPRVQLKRPIRTLKPMKLSGDI